MYNGIGLRTVRGSGTNGYVQRNLSYVNASRTRQTVSRTQRGGAFDDRNHYGGKSLPPNPEILLHEQKRKIEVQLMEMTIEMESRGCDESEIESKVSKERERLLARLTERTAASSSKNDAASSHARAQRKEEEITRMKSAFGITADHMPGESFDPEMQEKRRQERKVKRQREYEERETARQLRLKEREERQHLALTNRDRSAGRPSARDRRSHSRGRDEPRQERGSTIKKSDEGEDRPRSARRESSRSASPKRQRSDHKRRGVRSSSRSSGSDSSRSPSRPRGRRRSASPTKGHVRDSRFRHSRSRSNSQRRPKDGGKPLTDVKPLSQPRILDLSGPSRPSVALTSDVTPGKIKRESENHEPKELDTSSRGRSRRESPSPSPRRSRRRSSSIASSPRGARRSRRSRSRSLPRRRRRSATLTSRSSSSSRSPSRSPPRRHR